MAKSYSIGYCLARPFSSISELIHFPLDLTYTPDQQKREKLWGYYSPPKPFPIAGKGYPYLDINYDGFHIWFTSTSEIDHFTDVYSRKVLPSAQKLTDSYDYSAHASKNKVWISRIPKLKHEKRSQIVNYVKSVDSEFRKIAKAQEDLAKINLDSGHFVPRLSKGEGKLLRPPFDLE